MGVEDSEGWGVVVECPFGLSSCSAPVEEDGCEKLKPPQKLSDIFIVGGGAVAPPAPWHEPLPPAILAKLSMLKDPVII